MKKTPDTFVTLEKYTNDLSRQLHRDKLLIEMLEDEIRKIEFDCTSQSMDKLAILRKVIDYLKLPLDSWITDQEWKAPIPVCKKPVKSLGSDELWPCHFEFEGER